MNDYILKQHSFKRPVEKQGSPDCGLYVKIPDQVVDAKLIENLKNVCKAINESPYEKNMHIFEYNQASKLIDKQYVGDLRNFAQIQGMICLARTKEANFDDLSDFDGVVVNSIKLVDKAQKKLSDKKIIAYSNDKISKTQIEALAKREIDLLSINYGSDIKKPFEKLRHWQSNSENFSMIENIENSNLIKELAFGGFTFIDVSYVFEKSENIYEDIKSVLKSIDEMAK